MPTQVLSPRPTVTTATVQNLTKRAYVDLLRTASAACR